MFLIRNHPETNFPLKENNEITVSKKMLKMFEEAGELEKFITGMESLGINATSIKSYRNKGKKGKKIKKSEEIQPTLIEGHHRKRILTDSRKS